MNTQNKNTTLKGVEDDMQRRLHEMQKSFPDVKTELSVGKAVAAQLGGDAARRFLYGK